MFHILVFLTYIGTQTKATIKVIRLVDMPVLS